MIKEQRRLGEVGFWLELARESCEEKVLKHFVEKSGKNPRKSSCEELN
jgi:hypothetical protein